MSGPNVLLNYLAKRGETTVARLAGLGLSRPALYRALEELLNQGRIVRVRRGVGNATATDYGFQ